MAYYTPHDYDSDESRGKPPELAHGKLKGKYEGKYHEYGCEKYLETTYGETSDSEHGKTKKKERDQSSGSADGIFKEEDRSKSASTSYGKSPKKGHTKYLAKLHGKLPDKFSEKPQSSSDSASTRGEIEQYHTSKFNIEGTKSTVDFMGGNIVDKITGLGLDFDSYSPVKGAKQGRQQKAFTSSRITPKIAYRAKYECVTSKEGEETVQDRLYSACFRGELKTVKDILRVHYDSLMPDEHGQTPLYPACIGNQPHVIDYLVKRGYVVDHQDNEGKTPLHVALECDQPAIGELLLNKYRASYKVRDNRHWTPFHSAIDRGYYGLCSRLSSNFKEEDINTDVSWLQLFAACYERQLETVRFLLATNADVNHVSSSGHTALYIACGRRDTGIVELLLENGAQESINVRGSSHSLAPIHIACARNTVPVLQLLLDHGADPNILNAEQKTASHVAVAAGYIEVLQTLLRCPHTNINAVNDNGNTCLQSAVHRGNLEIVSLLLSHNACMNTLNYRGISPLHVAIDKRDSMIAQKLLEHNADPNILDSHGDNCLQLALYKREEKCVPMLLKAGADVSASDKDGDTCLHLAIYKKCSTKTLHLLIEHGAPLEQRNKKDYTALLIASKKGRQDAIQLLLTSGCDPNIADIDGDSVLHNAVHMCCNTETVQALIDHGAHVNAVNKKGHTVLMLASVVHAEDVFQLLLQHGADPNIGDWEGYTPLHFACKMNDNGKVALLLKHGADPVSKTIEGYVPLGLAATAKNPTLLQTFFNHNPALLDLTMDSNETALHVCCRKGKTATVKWMLSHGVDKDKVSDKGTALDVALSHGHKNIVFMLIDAGADVSMSPERPGFIGRIYPQRHRYMDILEHIVTAKSCSVDFTLCDAAHETLFFKACRDGDVDLVEMMLDSTHDIGINICNKEGQTPVAIICASAGKPESEALSMLSLIVNSERAVDVDRADNKQTTPLHLVCQENNAMMVNLILRKSRGSVNARDSMGRTPVQLAETADVINLLVAFGANRD